MIEKEEELNRLNGIYNDKLAIYEALMKALGQEVPDVVYKATKGDLVDEMLAKYINIANCPVPIKRLGGGFYLFGLKKIYAKIMNGKLVIRVGGGYMIIEEFISNYAQAELNKLEALARREGVSNFMELDLEFYALGTSSNRNSVGGERSPGGKSPNSSTYKANTSLSSSINGTSRPKTLTAGQLKSAQEK